ncbi:MAG: alpha/beta fold hydrolase [Pseudomonadota bacterium]
MNIAHAAPATVTPDWQRGEVTANGIKLHYEIAGPANGEPLLLVMGLSAQLIHWPDAFCAQLVDQGFRVIRFDNRDIGLSGSGCSRIRIRLQRDMIRSKLGAKLDANYTLYDMAKDTVGLLDALGIPKAHFVGASMGGMISQIVAGTHPERVLSLTSIMSSTNSPKLPMPKFSVLLQMAPPFGVKHDRASVIARVVKLFSAIGSPAYPTPLAERERIAALAFDRAYRPAGMLRQTHGILATGSFEPVLANVKAPTQVIHGLDDPLVRPAGGQRTAQLIRGAKLELIKGMGHDFPVGLAPRWVGLIAANAGRA